MSIAFSSSTKSNQESLISVRSKSTHPRISIDEKKPTEDIKSTDAESSMDIDESKSKSADVVNTLTPAVDTNASRKIWSPCSWRKGTNQKAASKRSADNMSKVRASRRVISPNPKAKDGLKLNAHEINVRRKSSGGGRMPSSRPGNTTPERDKSENATQKVEMAVEDKTEKPNSKLQFNKDSRRLSIWDKDEYSKNRFAPRLNDLPPVTINIYENPCSERESKEKWRESVTNLRKSILEETRSEAELIKYNIDIRKKWQNSCKQIKKDRLTAMVKDKMKITEGEQLTLVKFLPKSKQSAFIKEAQLAQHKM